jgi:SAM-dependent methyltransferase
MHPTAMSNCKIFFDTYSDYFSKNKLTKVVEIGSQDVNGSLRLVCPSEFQYTGVDFVPGKGVDIVLSDPYSLPFDNESADIVLSSSCFEHSEMFWVVFLEIMRVLKPSGLFYLNAPSNGAFHRYPVDCWRFYPDSGDALISWAKRNGINAVLLESYISNQRMDGWNDFVGVFLKNKQFLKMYDRRILDHFNDFKNGKKYGVQEHINKSSEPEDVRKLMAIGRIISNDIKIN